MGRWVGGDCFGYLGEEIRSVLVFAGDGITRSGGFEGLSQL